MEEGSPPTRVFAVYGSTTPKMNLSILISLTIRTWWTTLGYKSPNLGMMWRMVGHVTLGVLSSHAKLRTSIRGM